MKYYLEDGDVALKSLNTSREGLSSEEANARLLKNGRNKLEAQKGKPLIVKFLEQL